MLVLREDHKNHLALILSHHVQVLLEFCKLSLEFLRSGPNPKIYQSAANKLDSTPTAVRNAIEGLSYLLIECCKHSISETDLRESIQELGFSEEQQTALTSFYSSNKDELQAALARLEIQYPRYRDMDWRFEVQVASRSLHHQVTPLVTLSLSLDNATSEATTTTGVSNNQRIVLQTDPVNLVHLTEVLEGALKEAKSQHTRRVQHSFQ